MICVAKVGIFSYIHEAMGSLPDLGAFFLCMHFCRGYFFDIEPQKRSRVTKLGAHTQHIVIQRFLPPSTSKQSKSEITCARDKSVIFSNIGQAISGSTARFPLRKKEHKSYFGNNRTQDFRTSRCAAYLLYHSGGYY